ncbi:MAG: hypothetical protein WKF37_11325 [Bryobacteraceae bacterium]
MIEGKLGNLEAWLLHIRERLDETIGLVQALARAGERIAELAEEQKKTEKLLQRLIQSRLSNGHADA